MAGAGRSICLDGPASAEGIREPSLRIDVAVSIRALRAALPVVLAHTPRARGAMREWVTMSVRRRGEPAF